MEEELTPFQKAGYTEDTVFKCVNPNYGETLFKLYEDDGSVSPFFSSIDGEYNYCCFWLPREGEVLGYNEDLVVYQEEETEGLQPDEEDRVESVWENDSHDVYIETLYSIKTVGGQEMNLNKTQMRHLYSSIKEVLGEGE